MDMNQIVNDYIMTILDTPDVSKPTYIRKLNDNKLIKCVIHKNNKSKIYEPSLGKWTELNHICFSTLDFILSDAYISGRRKYLVATYSKRFENQNMIVYHLK